MNAKRLASLFLASAMLALAGAGAARAADITVVSSTTTKNYPAAFVTASDDPGKQPVITITYYKNNKCRAETGNNVEIFDGEAGLTYSLNPDAKTFMVTQGALGPPPSAVPLPTLAALKLDNKTFVEPGNQTRIIAGQKTKNYKYLAIFKVELLPGSASPVSSSGTSAAPAQLLPLTITVEGEEWAAEGLRPGVNNPKSFQKAMAGLSLVLPMASAAFEEYARKKSVIKGLTLYSTSALTFSFPQGAAAVAGDLLPTNPITETTETKVVSTASLDDALFSPPADYKKVDALLPPPPAPSATPAT